MSSSKSQPAFYPIRVVSNETGVNAITLRAWERRYKLLTPKRTEKGHRLYSENDIATIKKVVLLLDKGIPISQAKGIIESDIEAVGTKPSQPSQWNTYKQQLIDAINSFDELALVNLINEVNQFFPADVTLRFLLLPIYQTLEEEAQEGTRMATLQFYEGFLQGVLSLRLSDTRTNLSGKRILLANITAHSDIKLMMLGTLLRNLGMEVIRLAGITEIETVTGLVKDAEFNGILLQLGENSLETRPDLTRLSAEVGQLVFCSGNGLDIPQLRAHGLIPLQHDEMHQNALTIRDLISGIA